MIPEQGAHPPTSKPQLLCLLVALPSALASEAPRSVFRGAGPGSPTKNMFWGNAASVASKKRGGYCLPFCRLVQTREGSNPRVSVRSGMALADVPWYFALTFTEHFVRGQGLG